MREQWCWIFNNLSTFVERPKNLDSSFDDVIKDADTSKLSAEQKKSYMEARKLSEHERLGVYEGGIEIGRREGIEKSKKEIAQNLLSLDVSPATISKATGLSEAEITSLK